MKFQAIQFHHCHLQIHISYLSIMSNSPIDVKDAVARTADALYNAVLSGKLDASQVVLDHITSTP